MVLLLAKILKSLLSFRYKIRVFEDPALQRLRQKPKGILFLPNHPALIDPVILFALIFPIFKPKVLIDEKQLKRPGMKFAQYFVDMFPIPDVSLEGLQAKQKIETTYKQIVALLKEGHNFVIYPAGRIYRGQYEDLGGNSFVYDILKDIPDIEMVLIRTTGLWGSVFGFGRTGKYPEISLGLVIKILANWLISGLFFVPKRELKVAFYYPKALPRKGTKVEINRFLEQFYNQEAPTGLYVPESFWSFGKARHIDIPTKTYLQTQTKFISPDIRHKVYSFLTEKVGHGHFQEHQFLAKDLMMDSLARAELVVWVETEFGHPQLGPDAFETVYDVLRAASGEVLQKEEILVERPDEIWFSQEKNPPLISVPEGGTLAQCFWKRVRLSRYRPIVADEKSGVKTYHELVIGVAVLRHLFKRSFKRQDKLGLMLPASVATTTSYLAMLCANKTPVFLNWTVGMRPFRHCVESENLKTIITSKLLISKLEGQGIDFLDLKERFVYLEDLAKKITFPTKLKGLLLAKLGLSYMERYWKFPEIGAILFTSGSEGFPKAVPLTTTNQLVNIRGVAEYIKVTNEERLIGFLPPFHSFGLMINVTLPILSSLPVVYYANPTEPHHLAKLCESYRPTVLPGTPTFLYSILRVAHVEQIKSLKLAVLGAEKSPDYLFDLLAKKCPRLTILEGYGITECSPVLAINPTYDHRLGTVGKILSNIEYTIVSPQNEDEYACGQEGLLLVRGPSIFQGYKDTSLPSPFVTFRGRLWYRTGDIVLEDKQGFIWFKGRVKRFAKIGGEMISLPLIEEILLKHLANPQEDEGPILAVHCVSDEKPDLILITTKELSRDQVNQILSQEGLSSLHHIKKIIRREQIPVLGSGKVDYQTLKQEIT